MAGGKRAWLRNGLGWCLPMEDTAGKLGIVFAQKKKKWIPLDNFLNFYEVAQLVFGQQVLLKG